MDLKRRKPALVLAGLASVVLTGCVQFDFVRDYPLAGYPSYATGGGGGSGYYSGGPYTGSYGSYYSGGYYYPGSYASGAYYPYSRGLYYAGDCYSPFPGSYFDNNHLRYGCAYPAYRGGYAGPLVPRVVVPPVLQPVEPDPRPKAPRGRNGGPIKDHRDVERRDVERPAALVGRSSAAVRSPAAPIRPPSMTPAVPASASTGSRAATAGTRTAIPSVAVRAPVPVAPRPAPAATPRFEPGFRGGPGLRAR